MSDPRGALDCLFLALSQLSELHQRDGFFLRAQHHPELAYYKMTCMQSFKPSLPVNALSAWPEDFSFDYALYAATRQREENRYHLARLWQALPDGGVLLTAQHNDLGAKTLEKDMKLLCGDVETHVKFHSRAIWAVKTDRSPPSGWLEVGLPQNIKGTDFYTAPGMFSWKKPDAGSIFLCRNLPDTLSGHGADLGAGWGYLSHHILTTCKTVEHLDLYEAEKCALNMAKLNLAAWSERTDFFWSDLQKETLDKKYDFIVCNPPVHDLQMQDITLGQDILYAGLQALKPRGRMYVVANRHLPYEDFLRSHKASVDIFIQEGGYKILDIRL